jgi:hypothetical protein
LQPKVSYDQLGLSPRSRALRGAGHGVPSTPPAEATSKDQPKKVEDTATPATAGPSAAQLAGATPVVFWQAFDSKENKQLSGDEAKALAPIARAGTHIILLRQTPSGFRKYEFWIHGTLERPLDKLDNNKFNWAGMYNFTPPSNIIKSTNGDEPIYFSDAGTARSLTWGQLKLSSTTRKKK